MGKKLGNCGKFLKNFGIVEIHFVRHYWYYNIIDDYFLFTMIYTDKIIYCIFSFIYIQ